MTKNTQYIPTGYKPSPLGLIPEDWEVKRLGEVGEVFSGGTPNTEIQEYWNGYIDWCTPTDITSLNGAIYIERTALKITDLGLKCSSAVLLPPNSIIVCTRATIGNAAISLHQITTNQGFKNVVPSKSIDTLFLYYTIVNNKIRLIRLGNGSTFLEVSKSDFENLTIPVPPLSEQQRIVSILSLWDTAIEKQIALIEKFTLRKRGLMQQLLTGKKRLKDFSGEWKEVRLGDVALITMGQSPDSKYYNEIGFGLPLIQGNADIQDRKSIQRIWTSSITKTCESGDIIMSVRAPVGEIERETQKSCIGRGVCAIRNTGIKKEYLYQLLLFEEDSWKNIEQGGTFTAINSNEIKKKTLVLPTTDEQTAIASVLVNADKEIELANEKLARMQAEKRGLMQVLLTGKKRVR